MPAQGIKENFAFYCPHTPPVVDNDWLHKAPENELYKLARAKISLAFSDLLQYGQGRHHAFERGQAERWLTQWSKELELWCIDAGLNVLLVIERAKELIEDRELRLRGMNVAKRKLRRKKRERHDLQD